MANINVSYGEIEQAASSLGTGRDEIIQQLQRLQGLISGLVSSGFVTDQASGRFHEAYQRYTAGANTVIEQLTEIQSFLTGTAAAMQDMDAQIASRIG